MPRGYPDWWAPRAVSVNLVTTAFPNPAPGTEFQTTVPTGQRWRLFAFLVRLLTSAQAGNRQVELVVQRGAETRLIVVPSTVLQGPSTGKWLSWSLTGGSAILAGDGLSESLPLPDTLLLGGDTLRVAVRSLQTLDRLMFPVAVYDLQTGG